jgi:hypothetical protein
MDLSLKDILQVVSQGGLAIVIFIIWYISQRDASKQNRESMNTTREAVLCANKTSQEAFDKHTELSKNLFQLLKDEQEYKTVLIGILDRISIKLETPAQCPILMTGKKIKLEVTE